MTAGQDDRAKEEMLVEEMSKQNDKVMATTENCKTTGIAKIWRKEEGMGREGKGKVKGSAQTLAGTKDKEK
jgi:hypothetical protein